MGKYIKLFKTHAEYEEYINSGEVLLSNVSFCIDQPKVVHYTQWEETRLVATFNVVSTSSAVQIMCNTSLFREIEIDGVVQQNVISSYTFDTTGEHVIKYTLVDNTSIGNQAFYYCTSLTSITIPKNVTSIERESFFNCSGLTSITIPNSVTFIGDSAFNQCPSLTSVTLNSNTIVSATYTSSSNLKNIFGTQVTSYVIGEDVTEIGDCAFQNCTSLTSVTIPSGVTSIGEYAFYNCDGLTTVTIPGSVISMGRFIFENCSGLTSVIIEDGVTKISRYAFQNCTSLTSITIPDSVIEIAADAFDNTPYKTNMPDGLVYINNVLYTYKGTMPNNTSINIRQGTVSISSIAFERESGLISITIPSTVSLIGNNAFYYCTGLTSVTIPDCVTSIDRNAFYYCTSLTSVTVESTVPPTLGANVFNKNASGRKIYVPADSVDTYKAATNWSSYAADIEAIPNV